MNRARPFRLSRRALLHGSGVALGLPYLEAMMPSTAVAAAAPDVPALGWGCSFRDGYEHAGVHADR